MSRLSPFFLSFILSFLISCGHAEEPKLLHVSVDIHNQEKCQRGARFFMNYCSGCHSLKYLRYSQMGKDLGLITFDGDLDEDLLYNNLIFTTAKVHDPINISMSAGDAAQWFGVVPPDLSLSARHRGPDWIYTYLKSFYFDPTRPFNTNNLLIPQVAMPNVLEPLAGRIMLAHQEGHSPMLMRMTDGEMTEQALNASLEDLVTFLAYVGEPAQLVRKKIGYFVLSYLFLFLCVIYALKKLYWKKLH